MSKQAYVDALNQARANYQDLQERGSDALGESWEDVQHELFSPAEISESRLRVDLMSDLKTGNHSQYPPPSRVRSGNARQNKYTAMGKSVV